LQQRMRNTFRLFLKERSSMKASAG
jgi:hypothetical protein